jgi:hypothetical protein
MKTLEQRLQAWARRPMVRRLALVLVLAGFAAQATIAARTHTPTPDEFIYVPTGYYHLRTGDLGFDSSNPPLLKMATALPLFAMDVQLDLDPRWRDNRTGWGAWIFGTRFMGQNQARYFDVFFAARLVVVAIGVALGVLVFVRACALLSPLGALGVLLLYGTTPTLVAHAGVATLDVGVTALLFAAFCALQRFAAMKTLAWAGVTGMCLGLAFVSKGVAALLFPLVPVMAALEWRAWDGAAVRRLIAGGAVMGGAAWVAVLAAYGFSGFPLPAPLVEGVRFQINASSAGEFPAFLNGAWSAKGWWYYYLEAFGLKTPIATLVFLAVGIGVMARGRCRAPGDLWMLIPPFFLLYVLSFHYGKNYGVRYLLPALPFLLLVAGRGVDGLLRTGRYGPGVVGALLAWQLVASVVTTPHQLAYFNELAGGPDRARRLLLDSNLDWGQDLGRLKTYMDAHGLKTICLGYFGHVDPHVYGIDYTFPATQPTPGRCAVSANFLAGYTYGITYAGERVLGVRPGLWSWFDRLRPVARVGRSIYVFDVTPEDMARLRQ